MCTLHIIEGESKIYGSPTIFTSTVSGNSVVCDNVVIRDESLESSNYFCGDTVEESRGTIFIDSMTQFLKLGKSVKLQLADSVFAQDNFQLRLNGKALDESEFFITGNRVEIRPENVSEGKNSIHLEARDKNGKKIWFESEVYVGSQELKLVNVGKLLSYKIKFSDDYIQDEVLLVQQGEDAFIKNIPQSIMNLDVEARIYTSTGYVDFNGPLIELGSEKSYVQWPKLNNIDNLNFDAGLTGWSVSSPGLVNFSGDKLIFDKTLKGKKVILSTSFTAEPNTHWKTRFESILNFLPESKFLTYFLINASRGTFGFKEEMQGPFADLEFAILPHEMAILSLAFFIPNDITSDYEVTVHSEAPGRYVRLELKQPFFYAKSPHNIKVENFDLESDCRQSKFNVDRLKNGKDVNPSLNTYFSTSMNGSTVLIDSLLEDMKFLSVGSDLYYDTMVQNRFFSWISLYNIDPQEIDWKQSKILISDLAQQLVVEAQYNACLFGDLNPKPHPGAESNEYLIVGPEANPLKFGFWLSNAQMKYLGILDGLARAQLKLVGKDGVIYLSNAIVLNILKSLSFNETEISSAEMKMKYTYGEIDSYSSVKGNTLLTSGDKWVADDIKDTVFDIWKRMHNYPDVLVKKWFVNDVSRLNGGWFPPHSSHQSGRDIDISYFESEDKLFNLKVADSAKSVIKQIKDFLSINQINLSKLRGIFLSALQKEATFRSLQNVCHDRRIISFSDGFAGKSLLRHAGDHYDHLHLFFKDRKSLANPSPTLPTPGSMHDKMDNLRFAFNSDGSFSVKPREEYASEFTGLTILWRLQDTFEDLDTKYLAYGIGSKQQGAIGGAPPDKVYLKIAFMNSEGGCSSLDFLHFKLSKLCKENNMYQAFTFHPSGYAKKSLTAQVSAFADEDSYICDDVIIRDGYAFNSTIKGTVDFHNLALKDSLIDGIGVANAQFAATKSTIKANFDVSGWVELFDSSVNAQSGLFYLFETQDHSSPFSYRISNSSIEGSFVNSGTLSLENTLISDGFHNAGNLNASNIKLSNLEVFGAGRTKLSGLNVSIHSLTNASVVNNYSDEHVPWHVEIVNSNLINPQLSTLMGLIWIYQTNAGANSVFDANPGEIHVSCANIPENTTIVGPWIWNGVCTK